MKMLNIDYKKHMDYSKSCERGIRERLHQKYDDAERERLMDHDDHSGKQKE